MTRLLRGAFVIARRDFAATVLSKTFLFFLLGPLFPLLFGGVFGGSARGRERRPKSRSSRWSRPKPTSTRSMRRARRWRSAIDDDELVRLVHYAPDAMRGAGQAAT